jgi:hypothetical protein
MTMGSSMFNSLNEEVLMEEMWCTGWLGCGVQGFALSYITAKSRFLSHRTSYHLMAWMPGGLTAIEAGHGAETSRGGVAS